MFVINLDFAILLINKISMSAFQFPFSKKQYTVISGSLQ